MEKEEIYTYVDNTVLSQQAKREDIKLLCENSIRCHAASVCIPPSYVKEVHDTYGDKLNICTVIGFPNGYNTTAVKAYETNDAINNGANEIDMVINIGWLMDERYDDILDEIRVIKAACGDKILKVIIETCLLNEAQKLKMCELVTQAGADYIKTSTGFSKGGATLEDVRLLASHIGIGVKVKAAGGVGNLEQAKAYIEAGCSRIGSSRLIK